VRGLAHTLVLAIAFSLSAGCTIPDIELTGRPCPCAPGWVCEEGSHTCVLDAAADGAASDAARVDGGGADGGPVVTIDGGGARDGGGSDGGTIVTPDGGGCTAPASVTEVWGDAPGSDHPGTLRDTWINLNAERHATDTLLRLYTWPTAQIANAILMRWDLSAIPAGATVTSATLELFQSSATGATYRVTAHELVRCPPDIAGDRATGYECSAGNPWTPNACCYSGVPMGQADIGPAVDTVVLDTATGPKTWNVTAIVRHWVETPSANLGMMIDADPTAAADAERAFSANEAPIAAQRPRLTVTYGVCD
jgi:hypothetical protein